MLDQATRAKIVDDLFATYETRQGLPLLSSGPARQWPPQLESYLYSPLSYHEPKP